MNLREHLLKTETETELRRIVWALARTSKYVSSTMHQANRKLVGTTNPFGEEQLDLDVLADRLLMERLRDDTSFRINQFASEEQDNILVLNDKGDRYSATSDPLDGSSLADVNLAVGSIIGIHDGELLEGKPGRESMAAAMYVLYGPLTTLVYTTGNGVHEFVLNREGDFILAKENIMVGDGRMYSTGGLRKDWLPGHLEFITALEDDGYKLRYSGAFVPDASLILNQGGLFTYPALKDAPNGKLRLLFELQPMAYAFEQAGGKAMDGKRDILDIVPENLDQRSPIYLGNESTIEMVKSYLH